MKIIANGSNLLIFKCDVKFELKATIPELSL